MNKASALDRKMRIWFYIVSILLAILSLKVYAAPPHPRLFLKQMERALKYTMNTTRIQIPQLSALDTMKGNYKPQPDGVEYILAIRIDFSDQQGKKPASVFNDAIFGTKGTSMRLYYEEVSYGQMHIQPGPLGGVVPTGERWYRASKPMSYYGAATMMVDRYKELLAEACAAADAGVDFSKYDRDRDGYVDHLMLIHAGNDEASTAVKNDIWTATINEISGTYDGVKLATAILVAEDPMNNFINIGIYCHQFFYEFGAPALFSWEQPVGHWCLMGNLGPYQDNGRHPSHISGYLKWDFDADPTNGINGWIKPTDLISYGRYSVDSFELPAGNRLYKADIQGKMGKEYFLIENRNKNSGAIYDTHLPESGIVIWHIDEKEPKWSSTKPTRRVWVEDPTDPDHIKTTEYKKITAEAAYSADDGQMSFTPTTSPDSNTNDGTKSGISIINISAEDMSMSFTFGSVDVYELDDSIDSAYGPVEYDTIYQGFIRDESDVDFYKFIASADSAIVVFLENIPENNSYDLQLYDTQRKLFAATSNPGNSPEALSFEVTEAGTYYAAVISKSGYSLEQPYYFKVTMLPASGIIVTTQAYPNPFMGIGDGIWFNYNLLTRSETLALDIYTINGELIYTHSELSESPTGRLFWDVMNNVGEPVAKGVYFFVFKAALFDITYRKIGKLVVIH